MDNNPPHIAPLDHLEYMRYALSLARRSPPKPTNFRVGAVLVDEAANRILSTGYTLESPGNTHAEQSALQKYFADDAQHPSQQQAEAAFPLHTVLYTTMEPCQSRSAGNLPCVDRILETQSGDHHAIQTVYIGLKEPETFVAANAGQSKLEQAGIVCIHVPGLEEEILQVATEGHRSS